MHAYAYLHICTHIYRHSKYCFIRLLHSPYTRESLVVCTAVRSKRQNVTHFMKSPTYFSVLRVNRPRKMICQLSWKKEKKKKKKAFFFFIHRTIELTLLRRQGYKAYPWAVPVYLLTQPESLHVREVLYERSQLNLFFVIHLL